MNDAFDNARACLTRISDGMLDPHANHDVAPWPGAPICGGRLTVADTHERRDRYELYCQRCNNCWPGALNNRADVMAAVREMSGMQVDEESRA